jgi:hypothetical protein
VLTVRIESHNAAISKLNIQKFYEEIHIITELSDEFMPRSYELTVDTRCSDPPSLTPRLIGTHCTPIKLPRLESEQNFSIANIIDCSEYQYSASTIMPGLDVIHSANAELADAPLVAVLTGGTTGIGSYIAEALARVFAKTGSNLRVYIVGRNASRADVVMKSGQSISPGSDWRFIKATDLALIREVDRCSAEVIKQETESPFHGGHARVDLLYMTHCYPILKERSSEYKTCSHLRSELMHTSHG